MNAAIKTIYYLANFRGTEINCHHQLLLLVEQDLR